MAHDSGVDDGGTRHGDVDYAIEKLRALEDNLDEDQTLEELQYVRRVLEHVPGTKIIDKYTTRDMGESFIGGLVFSLPLLVEDGVFDIAEWLAGTFIGPVPVFLVISLFFIFVITTGLLYAVDFREVKIYRPVFGIIPRRLIGILSISFVCAFGMMFLWGRLHEGDPTTFEAFCRGAVVWFPAALGAVLADLLPGESKGDDISTLI